MTAKQLVDKLASYDNVGLLMSFQSFNDRLQDNLVTSKDDKGNLAGLKNYSKIRNKAIVNLFNSKFYDNGITNRRDCKYCA